MTEPYRPRYFILQELVDPTLFEEHGENCWALLDMSLVRDIDNLRQAFGVPITINDWHRGGRFKESGLRRSDTKTGAALSMHKQGKGFDLKVAKPSSASKLHSYILTNQKFYPAIRRMEAIGSTPGWVHVDSKPHKSKQIRVFKP